MESLERRTPRVYPFSRTVAVRTFRQNIFVSQYRTGCSDFCKHHAHAIAIPRFRRRSPIREVKILSTRASNRTHGTHSEEYKDPESPPFTVLAVDYLTS